MQRQETTLNTWYRKCIDDGAVALVIKYCSNYIFTINELKR